MERFLSQECVIVISSKIGHQKRFGSYLFDCIFSLLREPHRSMSPWKNQIVTLVVRQQCLWICFFEPLGHVSDLCIVKIKQIKVFNHGTKVG
jgi:hypothetical protein